MPLTRRRCLAAGAALAGPAALSARAQPAAREVPAGATTAPRGAEPGRWPTIRPPRLRAGHTVALVNPSRAVFEREPYENATLSLRAMGFEVREAPHLRARRGPFAGTDAERAADIDAMFADRGVHGILALAGGSGGNRVLPRIDYDNVRRNPKFFGGFSDLTALVNAIHAKTGLVTFHAPLGSSEWNAYSTASFRGAVVDAQPLLLANPQDAEDALVPRANRITTLRGGKARGVLAGGNLAVFAAMAGSGYWPSLDGAILFLEDINEYIYRVDRMLSTLKLAGAFDRLAGVVLGAFTNCTPGEGYGALTLDEVFEDYFGPLGVPVYAGASFGHIRRKMTLPVGLDVEMDADAGTIRFLRAAVV